MDGHIPPIHLLHHHPIMVVTIRWDSNNPSSMFNRILIHGLHLLSGLGWVLLLGMRILDRLMGMSNMVLEGSMVMLVLDGHLRMNGLQVPQVARRRHRLGQILHRELCILGFCIFCFQF